MASEDGGNSVSQYQRPVLEWGEFYDAAGAVIDYGDRWASQGSSPPEESYSVDENPERFSPLHDVARALLEYLAATYEVEVLMGEQATEGLLHRPLTEDIVEAARLTPVGVKGAPLVLVLTRYPGVRVYAGALFWENFPTCGCKACDENCQDLADQLESLVFSVVTGGLTERISRRKLPKWSFQWGTGFIMGMGQTVSYELRSADGETVSGGQSRAKDVPKSLLQQARTELKALAEQSEDGAWQSWMAIS